MNTQPLEGQLSQGNGTRNYVSHGETPMLLDNLKANHKTANVSEIEEIFRYVSLLWKWAWLIILVGLVAASAAYFVSQLLPPVYQTSTTLLVMNGPNNEVQDYGSVQASQSLAGTYSDLLTEESVLSEVITRLGLSTDPVALAKSITVTPVRSTQRIIVSVEGSDRVLIAYVANGLVDVFTEKLAQVQADRISGSKENLQNELANLESLIQSSETAKSSATNQAELDRLDGQISQYRQMYAAILDDFSKTRVAEIQAMRNVVQISPAGLSYTQISPNVLLITLLAGAMGMALMAGFVLVRDALDKTIKTPEEISEKLNLPVVGIIYKHKGSGSPIVQANPNAPASESFRLLAMKVQYAGTKDAVRSILVTSPTKAEGKTTVSINMAFALAQAGKCVTLIDSNFCNPSVHQRLKLNNNTGLSNLLLPGQSGHTNQDIVQKIPNSDLFVISSGENLEVNRNLYISKRFGGILKGLVGENRLVVVDSAPVLQSSDTVILSTMVDGLILVIHAGKTTLAEAKQAVESLQWVNANIIGVVLNNAEGKAPRTNGGFQNRKH